MYKLYKVTFQYDEDVWCTNLAKAVCIEQVRNAYQDYKQVMIREAQSWEISEAITKHMPIVDCRWSET